MNLPTFRPGHANFKGEPRVAFYGNHAKGSFMSTVEPLLHGISQATPVPVPRLSQFIRNSGRVNHVSPLSMPGRDFHRKKHKISPVK